MYGTVATLNLKPGAESQFLQELTREVDAEIISGARFQHLYRLDASANTCILVIAFTNREAYQSNASSSEQHQRYLRFRALLTADPEWHDGEIIWSHASAPS